MSTFGSGPIVVTGASGWVGRTVLDQLAQLLSREEFRSRLRAFSSHSGVINLDDGLSIPSRPLSELPALVDQEGCSYFLHAAFLTPNRCAELGIETYTQINRSITKTIEIAVKASSKPRVVLFSSGAAACIETNQDMSSSAAQIYGALKLEEEHLLQSVASTLVLRIYALSGRFIRDSASFALGGFLLSALHQKRIHLHSGNPVIRGYVSAGDVARCGLSWLFSDHPCLEQIAAVSEITTLKTLASLISDMYGLQPPLVPRLEGEPSSYSFSPIRFRALCDSFGMVPMSMKDQILDTALGMRISMYDQQL